MQQMKRMQTLRQMAAQQNFNRSRQRVNSRRLQSKTMPIVLRSSLVPRPSPPPPQRPG